MYTNIPTEIRLRPSRIHPRERWRQRRHLISISHPRGPFLIQTVRAKALSLSFSERLYAREITYIFNGHAWLFVDTGPFDFTAREMCSDERGSWQGGSARRKYAARGKGPQRSPREGTFRDARYVRNLSSTAAATITSSVLLLL